MIGLGLGRIGWSFVVWFLGLCFFLESIFIYGIEVVGLIISIVNVGVGVEDFVLKIDMKME